MSYVRYCSLVVGSPEPSHLRQTSPGDRLAIDAVNAHVVAGTLYKALKEIRKLMKREQELLAA
jgi:flagellar protein FlbT